jgi:CxxC motif-containing protein (DUF1111 family)
MHDEVFRMAPWFRVAILAGLSAQAESSDAPIGGVIFADPRDPPSYRLLDKAESERVNLGRSVFETEWAAAGTPGIAGRIGVGPLFNAASCTACHKKGARGGGPVSDGPVPIALVIQLESPSPDGGAEPGGDPIYGRILNTSALDGVRVEGVVTVEYSEVYGYYYPYGGRWSMRVPHYRLATLNYGPLAPKTVIKPRLAPALFGAGLLDAVPETAISQGTAHTDDRTFGSLVWHSHQGVRMLGRLGWQGGAVSIRDQTTGAFAREMGLTTDERSSDDCTPAEADCRQRPNGGSPEVSEELLDAVVTFVRMLAVPVSPTRAEADSLGSELFEKIGCATCHRPRLPVELPGSGSGGARVSAVIAPYTDLRLHDLGIQMADENASGEKVTSRWRTAPLWGLGYRLRMEAPPTFLHDGRARSAEEAILWHSGEAARARHRFADLGPNARKALLAWLGTL